MSGYTASLAVGRVAGSETDILMRPRDGARGQRGVLLHHGALATAAWWEDATGQPNSVRLAAYLAQHFVVVAADFGGDLYGNATDVARMDAGRAVLAANGCATDKALLVGLSAGAMSSMGFIRDRGAANVACFAGLEPATNLTDLWTRNIFGQLQAQITAATGTAFPGTLPIWADPYANAAKAYRAQLATVPGKFWYSRGDTIVLPTFTETLAAEVGYDITKVSSTDDHGDTQIGHIDVGELVYFLRAHAAAGT